MRSRQGGSTVGAKPAADSTRSLKAMAWAKMRPSTSGSTTCMARSRGNSPRGEPSQLARDDPASATCRTGQSNAASTPASSWAVAVANAVALTMISGGCAAKRRAQERRRALVLEAGDIDRQPALSPRASSAARSASIGAVSPPADQRAVEITIGVRAGPRSRARRPEAGRRHRPRRRRQSPGRSDARRIAAPSRAFSTPPSVQ